MSLWLIPVGIAAWFLVAIVVGLCIGPVLGRCSQTREAADQPGLPGADVGIARRDQNVTL